MDFSGWGFPSSSEPVLLISPSYVEYPGWEDYFPSLVIEARAWASLWMLGALLSADVPTNNFQPARHHTLLGSRDIWTMICKARGSSVGLVLGRDHFKYKFPWRIIMKVKEIEIISVPKLSKRQEVNPTKAAQSSVSG